MDDEHTSTADVVSRLDDDAERVRREYARRAADPRLRAYYARIGRAMAWAESERRQALREALATSRARGPIRVLDVGCGSGDDLAALVATGFAPADLAGVDLLEDDVMLARARLPGVDVNLGNGATLPYPDEAFDAVYQTTVLSSIIDAEVRARVADEMVRVTRDGGLVISYDIARVADGNPHLVPVDDAELRRLFSDVGDLLIRRMTLDMRIAPRVPPRVATVLDRIPVARQARFAILTRRIQR